MRLVCISDTHGLHEQVRLPAGEVLLHAGDLSDWGRLDEVADFLSWFSQVGHFRHRVFIAGNHDFAFERSPRLAENLIPRNVIYLNDSGIVLDGLKVWGSPITPSFCSMAFNRDDTAIQANWNLIPDDVDVLVTHGPPLGIMDRVLPSDLPVGCPLLAQAIARCQPRVHVFGHIHEGYGQQQQDDVLYVNAAICDHKYAVNNAPQVIQLRA